MFSGSLPLRSMRKSEGISFREVKSPEAPNITIVVGLLAIKTLLKLDEEFSWKESYNTPDGLSKLSLLTIYEL